MYDRLFVQVCGMFNGLHAITILLFFALLALLLYLSRHMTEEKSHKLLRWVAIFVSALEIVKITSRILQGYGPDSWVPLYYCSLFIFAIWLTLSGKASIRRAGCAYITMGGIVASVFFTFYPSTSLGMYPLLHPATFHSFVYHLIMCYTGLILLWKGGYVPQKRDGLYYSLFVFGACIPAVILNEVIGTNCMFLRHPFNLPLLQPLLEFSKPLYILVASLAQAVVLYWVDFGLYGIYKRLKFAEAVHR